MNKSIESLQRDLFVVEDGSKFDGFELEARKTNPHYFR